jgi:hypothetical protein
MEADKGRYGTYPCRGIEEGEDRRRLFHPRPSPDMTLPTHRLDHRKHHLTGVAIRLQRTVRLGRLRER